MLRNRSIHILGQADEEIARRIPPQFADFSKEARDRIAKIAFLITQEENKRGDGPPSQSWEELSDRQRDASSLGVLRVVQAMALLGWIEPP